MSIGVFKNSSRISIFSDFLNMKQISNKVINNYILFLKVKGSKGYCCELDTLLFKWQFSLNYVYSTFNYVYSTFKLRVQYL